MKTIIFKELSENAKWAALMLVIVAAAMFFGAPTGYYVFGSSSLSGSLVGNAVHVATALAFPAVGLALGMLQVLQDYGWGRWSFLTHRPISRTRIFWGKVIAGTILYLLAGGIPLAALVVWFATPGNSGAPFEWQMILPRLADLLSGLVAYAGGLLIATRRARWVGSRLMPVAVVFASCLIAALLPSNLGQALLILGAGILLLLPSAWSAFVAGGTFETQPVITRLLQTIAVGFGLVFCCAIALQVTDEIISSLSWRSHAAPAWRAYEISGDGQIGRTEARNGRTIQWTDLQGTPHPELVGSTFLPSITLDLTHVGTQPWESSSRFQAATHYVRELQVGDSIAWFYLVNRRTIEGFSFLTLQPVGSVGPYGFLPPTHPAQAFDEPLNLSSERASIGEFLIAGATTAYRCDPGRRIIQPIYHTSSNNPILDVGIYPTMNDRKTIGMAYDDVVLTRSTVRIFQGQKELLQVPLEHRYPPYQQLRVGLASTERWFFWYSAPEYSRPEQEPSQWIVETDAQGHVTRRAELPPLRQSFGRSISQEAAVLLALPPVFDASGLINDSWEFGKHLAFLIVELVAIIVFCGFMCFRLSRRYDLTTVGTAIWTIIGMALGIPGVLLLVSTREPAASIRCPACGKRRLVARNRCEHCGEPSPKPAETGIEIFAGAPEETPASMPAPLPN